MEKISSVTLSLQLDHAIDQPAQVCAWRLA
jgi:hypothetical protein